VTAGGAPERGGAVESPWARAVRETQALTALGRYDEAFSRLRSALDHEHDEAEWWTLRAVISAALECGDDARSAAARAVALDPENGVRRALWVLLTVGWLDPAVLARRNGRTTRRQRRQAGQATAVEDPTATPLAQAARAVQLSPGSDYCWYALSRARAAVWDLDGATEAARRCGALTPGSRHARLAVASVAEYRHDWAAALAEFRALLADDPSDDWILERVARIELVMGEPVGAIADLVKAGRTTVSPSRRRRIATIVETHVTAQGIVTVWWCALALIAVIVTASILGPPPVPAAAAIAVLTIALGGWVRRRRRAVLAVLPQMRRAATEARFIRFDRTFSLVAVLVAGLWVGMVWRAPEPTPARMAADRTHAQAGPVPRYRTTCTTVPTGPTFTTPSSFGPPLPPAPPVTFCVPQVETGGPVVTRADVAEAARVARVHQLWYLIALIAPSAAVWAWRPRRRGRDGRRESGRAAPDLTPTVDGTGRLGP
jgi:hypothetical protein